MSMSYFGQQSWRKPRMWFCTLNYNAKTQNEVYKKIYDKSFLLLSYHLYSFFWVKFIVVITKVFINWTQFNEHGDTMP
jgi:hypothetical protein